jgi:hypothetical protein
VSDIIKEHGDRMHAIGVSVGRAEALTEVAQALVDLGHNKAAKVVIDLFNADRIKKFTEIHNG